MKANFGFSPQECRILSGLDRPRKIQRFVDRLEYNLEENGETCFSPRKVLRERKANCIEGAIFGAAALRFIGHNPLLVDLVVTRDDDHVIAVFRENSHWGAIAKSKYTGLTYREPVYKTIRELVMSYFEDYFNFGGEKTLRAYSMPVSLSRFDKISWMTTEKNLFCIGDYLNTIKHKKILSQKMAKNLSRVSPIAKEAGELWMTKNNLLEKAKNMH